jgi:hypothetical protein
VLQAEACLAKLEFDHGQELFYISLVRHFVYRVAVVLDRVQFYELGLGQVQ